MQTTNSSTTAPTPAASPVTPFPVNDAKDKPRNAPDAEATSNAAKSADATPIVDRLVQRATSSAHDAVDSVSAKISSITGGLQDGAAKVTDTRDEWIDSAREAIRQHPFATVAGALVVGAALLSLLSSRD